MKRRMQQSDNGSIVAFVLRRKDSVSHEKVQQHFMSVACGAVPHVPSAQLGLN